MSPAEIRIYRRAFRRFRALPGASKEDARRHAIEYMEAFFVTPEELARHLAECDREGRARDEMYGRV